MAKNKVSDDGVIVIKKYANRRLYNTASSSYVTLDHLCQMVKDGEDFVVYDAKSGEDITRSVLTQIIFEEEGKGQNMLPVSFLKKIIGFYGDSLQAVVPNYLDATMDAFSHNQDDMRNYVGQSFGGMPGMKEMEELGRRNMAMFEQTMRMMNPFLANQDQAPNETQPQPSAEKQEKAPDTSSDTLDLLRRQMTEMQNQIEKLAKG
jgi:polyhydroxyalkanoate synthesis repressor PhaR